MSKDKRDGYMIYNIFTKCNKMLSLIRCCRRMCKDNDKLYSS